MIFLNIQSPMLDMAAHEPGVFSIELDGLSVTLQALNLVTAERKDLRPEIHRKNIDVQFLASGGPEERIPAIQSGSEPAPSRKIVIKVPVSSCCPDSSVTGNVL